MRLRDHYDWVVLGNHPGALLSASLVAQLGLSVLVLPMESSMGRNLHSASGLYLDPESNYLVGLGKSGKLDGLVLNCLNHIGIQQNELDQIQTQECLPQALTSNTRFVLAQQEDLAFEIQREFGKAAVRQFNLQSVLKQTESETLTFWNQLPKRLTLSPDKKRIARSPHSLESLRKKILRSLKSSDPTVSPWLTSHKKISDLGRNLGISDLTETAEGLWYWITSSPSSNPSLFSLLHSLNLSRTGATFRGGLTAYREFLLEIANRLEVHIPAKTECRRIFIEKGRFVGVQITNRSSMIPVKGAILGCSLAKAYAKANYTGRNWFRRGKAPLTPQGWKFTLALTVHKEAILPGMLPRFIWKEKESPVLEVEVVNSSDYGGSKTENRIIYLRTIMPYSAESLTTEYQRLMGSRMLRQVMEILPFLELHLVHIYPDFRLSAENSKISGADVRMDSSSRDLTLHYGFASLEDIPDNLLIYSGKGFGSKTGIDGLFIAAESSYPGLGSLGGTVAALESVAWIAHKSGLSGPFHGSKV